ncbi:MAG: cell division protein FtsL [Epsilonproteobacteria bacterium]|nr:cell division protein FtsL [Campylobacterota bacterium]
MGAYKYVIGILLSATFLFCFAKIYQHNTIIRLRYKLQRLEQEHKGLELEKQQLLVQVCQLQDHSKAKELARKELNMQELNLKQVKVLTLKTTTSQTVTMGTFHA